VESSSPSTLATPLRQAIRCRVGRRPKPRVSIGNCRLTVAVVGDSELVDVTITWAGGHDTAGQAFRPVARLDQLSYYPQILALVTELTAAGQSSAQIARVLNDRGLRPPKRTDRFGSGQILTLARRLGLRVQHPRGTRTALTNLGPDRWSVAEIAVTLEMPTASVYNWIYRGWITARHASGGTRNYWIIEADADELQRLRQRRARPPGYLTRARWTEPGKDAPDDPGGQACRPNTAWSALKVAHFHLPTRPGDLD
jgi:hypothetical protein